MIMMNKSQQQIQDVKIKIIPILKSEGVLRSGLFGSFVRGEANEKSDIDILVDLPEGTSLLDLVRLKMRLEKELDKEVDVVTYEALSPYLRDIILKEEIPIYEQGS